MTTDPNDLRRLRAALELTRFHQRVATGGFVAAGLCIYLARNDALQGTAFATFLVWAAPAIALISLVPFLRTKCPQCRKRYNSPSSFFRSADNPAACVSCGFNIGNHLPRYGRPGSDA